MKTAIIDADSIIHIVAPGYAVSGDMLEMMEDLSEDEKVKVMQDMYEALDKKAVLAHVDNFINDIILKTDSTHYIGFVGTRSGSKTFRHEQAKTKPYKGNRKGSAHWVSYWKPIMIEHMVEFWNFIELSNIEADDACIMCACAIPGSVVCSPDKDLRQIVGEFYDYKKCEFETIDSATAVRNLYTQCLVGDSVDNIPGCPGVGKKSPFLKFPECVTPEDYHKYTYEVFKSKGHGELMGEQLMLVYMLRSPDGKDITTIPTPNEKKSLGNQTDSIRQESNLPGVGGVPINITFAQ